VAIGPKGGWPPQLGLRVAGHPLFLFLFFKKLGMMAFGKKKKSKWSNYNNLEV
jgi:hypothetical protein